MVGRAGFMSSLKLSCAPRRGAVRRRAPNACVRCRQHKIKCSGRQPCEQCLRRGFACNYDTKVLVSSNYVIALQEKASLLEGNHRQLEESNAANSTTIYDEHVNASKGSFPTISCPQTDSNIYSHESAATNTQSGDCSVAGQLTNPFSNHTPAYVADCNGRPWYLGVSSNWSFNRHVLTLAHERILKHPLPSNSGLYDSTAYDLGWDGLRQLVEPDETILPPLDHALFLINAVKFYCNEIFHLFDEESFMSKLFQYHRDPQLSSTSEIIWYLHYLLLLAFGKAFVAPARHSKAPPGADLFVQAMKLLPHTTTLHAQPIESIEVLCCAALYYQCLDFRGPAYNIIGQAVRIAIQEGINTSMIDQGLQEKYVKRCHNIWWTVYILDRQMSSLMGAPQDINHDDITAPMPQNSNSTTQNTSAMVIHVKLSRVLSKVLNTVYGKDGRVSKRFVPSIKVALESIAAVTDELASLFPLPVNGSRSGISRLAGYLHLYRHQCVVVATRPLLFTFFKMKLESSGAGSRRFSLPTSIKALIAMCVNSSQQIMNILTALQEQSLLDSFLPFDLDAAFAGGVVLLLASVTDQTLLQTAATWREQITNIFGEMTARGNLVASARAAEIRKLEEILEHRQQGENASFNQILMNSRSPEALAQGTSDAVGVELSMASEAGETLPARPESLLLAEDEQSYASSFLDAFENNPQGGFEYTGEQLLMLVDGLDLERFEGFFEIDDSTTENTQNDVS